MPSGLTRYQQAKDLHFITFSCYHRQPKLASPEASTVFEHALEQTRLAYAFGTVPNGYEMPAPLKHVTN